MKWQSIIDHIAKNNVAEVFKEFEQFFGEIDDIKHNIITLQNGYSKLKDEERTGTIDPNELSIKNRQIIKGILEFVTRLETLSDPEIDHKKGKMLGVGQFDSPKHRLRSIAQEAILDKDYLILSELSKSMNSIYYKAGIKDSLVENEFYVVQLFNRYQLEYDTFHHDTNLLEFFYKEQCPPPFVPISEFSPETPSYIIRKFIIGTDLNNLLVRGIKFSIIKSLEISLTIAEGLKELHRKSIFHNNLIPEKVIMDMSGEAHLLPMNVFGDLQRGITWKQLKDSIKFMSPEQLNEIETSKDEEVLNSLSNQYSLALISFFILTGISLYGGNGLPELYKDRVDDKGNLKQLKDFSEIIKSKINLLALDENKTEEISSNLIEILRKLLRIDAQEPFETVEEVIDELDFIRLQLVKAKRKVQSKDLSSAYNSYKRAIVNDKVFIEEFYKNITEDITATESLLNNENRDPRLHYSLEYLLNSTSNFEDLDWIEEASSCLVQIQHNDFTIEDYKVFFMKLIIRISQHDPEWDEEVNSAWEVVVNKVMFAIENLFKNSGG